MKAKTIKTNWKNCGCLFTALAFTAAPAHAVMDGQGHDIFPVTAIFNSSASVIGGQGLLVTYGINAGTVTLSGGITAFSGTFTQSGGALYSLQTSSGINVLAGGVTAPFFMGGGSGLTSMAAAQVGLGNVTNVAQLPSSYLDTDNTLTANSDVKVASQKAAKGYVDSWTRPCVNPADANDIMVPVGGWCVDKYEASVWSTATGGTQYGVNGVGNDDYPGACTDIGSGCLNVIYARSVAGVKPSTYATWFQSAMACANAGKELLPNAVWQTAALGTPDPGAGNSVCNVASYGTPMNTGALGTCVSNFGAFDMAGNVWEWVADWGAYAGTSGAWMNDYVWASVTTGVPAVFRGGSWVLGAYAGVFAFDASNGPSDVGSNAGFRCGRRR